MSAGSPEGEPLNPEPAPPGAPAPAEPALPLGPAPPDPVDLPSRARGLLRGLGHEVWAGPAVLLAVWALVPTHPDTQQAWGALEQPGVPLSARLGAWLLQLGLLAGLSALGLALGALASFAWGGSLAIARWRPGAWVRWSLVGATVLVLDGWLVSASMIRHPHPYAFWFHERGGLLAAYQQALTTGAYRSAGVLGWGAGFLAGWLGLVFALPRGRRYGAEALARRWRGLAAVGALACVGLLLTSGRRVRPWPEATAAGSAREDERPNVLVLCVESLRADCVDPQIAPTLYALAQRGVWFRNAHVSCPRTTQGLTSLLTGRWPRSHGLRHMFPPRAQRQALGLTLPRALAASGYRTACFADDAYGPLALFDYGFASKPPELGGIASVTVRSHLLRRALPLMPLTTSGPAHDALPFLDSDWFANDPERQAQEIGDALAAWGQGSPWFAFAFFSGPHMPYAAPEPYYRRFTDPRYPGPSRYGFSWQVSDAPFDQRQIRGLYNGSVYAADRALRAVLERLEREGLERKTIVVVLGDHGELMHEANRGYGHGDHLFADAQVTTAFALYDPRSATPHSVPGIVRDIDLAPTLASLCGVELPGADGVDLGPLLRGEVADLDLPAFCESGYAWETRFMRSLEDAVPFPRYPSFLQYEDGDVCLKPELEPLARLVKHRSLCRGRYKLCYMPTLRGEQRGARWWLFDVVADPLELRDLSAELPEVRAALEAELRSWLTADGSRFEDGWVLDATSRAE